MEIILNPNAGNTNYLREVYQQALREATEIYIATAYLTEWDKSLTIGRGCKRITFLVGTDFGLSRKQAMRNVLLWLPKTGYSELIAVPSLKGCSFHPKILIWKTNNKKYFSLTGSSNLTRAAFQDNYEANAFSEISRDTYKNTKSWMSEIAEKSIPVTDDWINNHYEESSLAVRAKKATSHEKGMVKLKLPSGKDYQQVVRDRRKQQRAFSQIQGRLSEAVRQCSRGEITNSQFWTMFWDAWSDHQSRFQGGGLQIRGKSANWKDACTSLVKVLDERKPGMPTNDLDALVASEIDRLKAVRNPARGAWFSEMLCHYFPDLYPVNNKPIKEWFKAKKWSSTRGASEGRRYMEMTKQLRYVVNFKPAGAKNLAELDLVIWLWDKKRQQKQKMP